jgi:hypothetical protein
MAEAELPARFRAGVDTGSNAEPVTELVVCDEFQVLFAVGRWCRNDHRQIPASEPQGYRTALRRLIPVN